MGAGGLRNQSPVDVADALELLSPQFKNQTEDMLSQD